MSTATPNKTKVTRQPTCPACKKRFRTTSTKKIYCTTQCQKEATKKKRRVSRTDRATHSAFFYHLAYECERAGTLQILTGHTVESLVALYDVYKLKLKANRYGETKDYEISHIHPVQGDNTIGLYHASNLVVVPTKLNRAHGSIHYGHGLSINRNTLVSKHSVEKGAPRKQTVQRIIAFLGADVVAEAVKIAKIQPTQRHKVLSWLHDHLDATVPEQRSYLDALDGMSGKALSALKAKLEGKEGNEFEIKTTILTPFNVLFLELERHAQHRPELTEVLDVICARVDPFVATFTGRVILNEEELQAVFDVLHGKPVEAIRDVLTEFVERYTSTMDNGERIPPYKPIVFRMQHPVRGVATVRDPVSFHAGSRSFADCLDGEGLDVPVLSKEFAAGSSKQDLWR
ncbi:hypothetical protein [Pseudomonas alvandae]|uniref:hypothetical protein n=1 Tax=Pseudomonas canavaninivorans TaxID=2842348 RepID=UPI0021606EAA|nr:hypothetical protein [Pseudomonas canavaninivorans]UVM74192.1 hypothetical protein LOY40_08570 [Pseudomonas canavaninivorans]